MLCSTERLQCDVAVGCLCFFYMVVTYKTYLYTERCVRPSLQGWGGGLGPFTHLKPVNQMFVHVLFFEILRKTWRKETDSS